MSKELVKEIFKEIDKSPQFSQIADRALADLKDRGLYGDSVNKLGFHDPEFAKQILQITSFASRGLGAQASAFEASLSQNDDVLRGLMLPFSLQSFISRELRGYDLGEGDLWEHSINCGVSSWMIATKVDFKDLEEAFVAGMMHDIGKVVLDKFLYEEKEKNVDTTIQRDLMPIEVESAVLGIDHAEVGALLAEKWNFSEALIDTIRYHHRPELANKEPDLAVIVHLADCMCMNFGLALGNDGLFGLLAGDLQSPQ